MGTTWSNCRSRVFSQENCQSKSRPASFLMLNGVLCCLSLSFIDALFVVGMPGKHTMVCSLKTRIREHLLILWNPLFLNVHSCVQVFCALVYVKVSEFKALSMFGNQQCHGMSDEQFWKTEYVVDWMSIGILPIRLILFLEMMVFFSMTFFLWDPGLLSPVWMDLLASPVQALGGLDCP